MKRRPDIQDVPCAPCCEGYSVLHTCEEPAYCPCDRTRLHVAGTTAPKVVTPKRRYATYALAMAACTLLFLAVLGCVFVFLLMIEKHTWLVAVTMLGCALALGLHEVIVTRLRRRRWQRWLVAREWYECLDLGCGYGTDHRSQIKGHAVVLGHFGWRRVR